MTYLIRGRSGPLPSLIAVVWVLLAPAVVGAQETPGLYLLDLQAGDYLLAESVPAYESGDTFLIDFALFLEAVEFPIEKTGEIWSGWSRSEDRNFVWRTDLGIVQLAGSHGERVEYDAWMVTYDRTYVSVQALERWFNLELDVDRRLQILTVDSSEPLPFQLWRERMLAKYRYRPGGRSDADVIVPDQYHWVTQPLVDLSTHLLTRKQDDGRNNSSTTSLAIGMDLLKHSVVYTGGLTKSSEGRGESTSRLTIERASLTPDTPMFAGAHRYMLGDIYQANPNLVLNSDTGRGFSIDRYPDGRTGTLSRTTIAGDAQPGWQAELYRNGTLLEFARVGMDGRYFFRNQEISFGENIFVVKLFGPQGQTREDRQTFWGGGADLDQGDFDFSISHIEFDRYLLEGTRDDVDGLAASYATDFRYAMALTENLQLGTAYTRTGLGSRERDGTFMDSEYLSMFGSMKLGPGVLIGEAAQQLDFGEAWSLEYLTGLNEHKISIAHRAFNDYESPATIFRNNVDALSEIAVFGSFGRDKQNGYTLRLRHQDLSAGSSDLRIFNQLSLRLGQLSLSNDLEHIVTSGPGRTTGHLKLAGRINNLSLRGQLDYQLTGDRPLRQISASMNWNMSERLNNALTLTKQLANDKVMYFTNLLSVRIREYDLTLSVSSNLDDAWSIGAGFKIAFGYDRHSRALTTDSVGLANTGRATMNLFIDANNDGVRDPGEPPVPWASYRDQETLKTSMGVLPLTSVPSTRAVRFDLRHLQLDDPFLAPRAKVYELTTHAGSDVSIDVAVVMTGDIEGHIFADSADDTGARGVVVSLHDADGREVATTRSEFDGFYSFTRIPSGDYEVRVSVNGGQRELVQPLSLDSQEGYIVLERIYIFE